MGDACGATRAGAAGRARADGASEEDELVSELSSRAPETRHLATLWELSGELLAVSTPSGHLVEVNGAWDEVLGHPRRDLMTRPFLDLVHPADLDATNRTLTALSRPDQRVRGFENRLATSDGRYRWLRWDSRSDSTGELIYSVIRDVTDQHVAQAELARSEERFRSALEHAPIGMALVGRDHRFRSPNEALCRALGYSAEELSRLTPLDVTHPDDREISRRDFVRMESGEVDSVTHEKRYLTRDGDIMWAMLSASAIRGDDGRPSMYVAQIVDISERKRQERDRDHLLTELERHNDELDQFAGAASHDLTSPLITMLGFLDLATTGPLDDGQRDLIERARRIGHRSLGLVRTLLRFSRLGTAELAFEPVDPGACTAAALDHLETESRQADAHVEVIEPMPRVYADAEALMLVLQNLIANAIKFRHDEVSPRIRVAASWVGDDVEITVDDNGPGIAPADRERVFEPFTRATGGRQRQGAGLGLATCRRVAERHGGAIAIEDSPLGGARFVLRLPAPYATDPTTDDDQDETRPRD